MQNTIDKIDQFENTYQTFANDIYKVSLYFLKEEKKAQKITEQVFFEFYEELESVDSDHIFAYLVYKAKMLSTNEPIHKTAEGEVRECE